MTAATDTDTVWLEARGLTKTFGGVTAIGDADLTLRRGEIRGIVGPNGAGKSTLMQMLAGLHQVDGGELLLDGEPVRFRAPDDAITAGISLVPQEMQLAPHHRVFENIVLGREPRRFGVVSERAARALAQEALDRLGAQFSVDDRVDELSPVGRRLVMVARALVGDARLLILDEPTAALAPQEADAILSTVESVAATGMTVLYVSHRFDDIERVAHTVTGVRDARVIADLGRSEITRAKLVELVTPVDALSHSVGPARILGEQPVRLRTQELGGGLLGTLDLEVHAGEIVGLAGIAGSGADDAIKLLAGLDSRAQGAVSLDDVPVAANRLAATRAGIAYVPGDRTLAALPSHQVSENIAIADLPAVSRWGVPSRRREKSLVAELAARVELAAPPTRAMGALSGGNQQKAIFARWMATDIRVLLLHDPTAGVDIKARAEIHQRVRELAADGAAVVLVTTDLPELVELADRVIALDRGLAVRELVGEQITEPAVTAAMTSGVGA